MLLTEYRIENNKPVIFSYGRNKDGVKYCNKIRDFKPYFYVLKGEECIYRNDRRVSDIIDDGFKEIKGKEVVKIVVNNPYDIRELKGLVEDSFEGDIDLNVRYSIDTIGEIEKEPIATCFIDIETDHGVGFPSPRKAAYPITAITCYNTLLKKMITFAWRKDMKKSVTSIEDDTTIIFDNEREMLNTFLTYIEDTNPDIFSAWNCIDEDEYIILNNKIKQLKNINIGEYDKENGIIYNKINSDIKDIYEIKDVFGRTLNLTNEHKIPLSTRDFKKSSDFDMLLNTETDIIVKDIDLNKKEYFLKYKLSNNKNKNLTYRKYLNSLYKNNEIFNFYCFNNVMCDKLSLIEKRKIFGNERGWHSPNTFLGSFGRCYNTIKQYIDKKYIDYYFYNLNHHHFYVNQRSRFDINDLTKDINSDIFYLLGMIYTDGTICKKTQNGNICNTNLDIIKKCDDILFDNKLKRQKSNYNKKKDGCYYLRFSSNKISFYSKFIYDNNLKKCLNIELLSQLSFEQFSSFIAGMIDGDGYNNGTGIGICIFNKGYKKELNKLSNLLLFNGLMCRLYKNNIKIMGFLQEKKKLKLIENKLICQYKKCTHYIDRQNYKCTNIKYKRKNNEFLVKINKISYIGEKHCYDLTTKKSYITCNGIQIHNCSFDMGYIVQRLYNTAMNYNRLSPMGVVTKEPDKYYKDQDNVNVKGRAIFDLLSAYKHMNFKGLSSFKLDNVAEKELGEKKVEYEGTLANLWRTQFDKFIEYNKKDVELLIRIDKKKKIIESFDEISRVSKCDFKEIFKGNDYQSVKVSDSFILSYCKNLNIILPSKSFHSKESFAGATVLTPIKGVHEYLTVFDFQGLYMKIALSLNCSPETLTSIECVDNVHLNIPYLDANDMEAAIPVKSHRGQLNKEFGKFFEEHWDIKNQKFDCNVPDKYLPYIHYKKINYTQNGIGVLPGLITYLFTKRDEMKKTRDTFEYGTAEYEFYERKQYAFKVIMNSIYGCIGYSGFRLYTPEIAASITYIGRNAILWSKRIVEDMEMLE